MSLWYRDFIYFYLYVTIHHPSTKTSLFFLPSKPKRTRKHGFHVCRQTLRQSVLYICTFTYLEAKINLF